MRKLPLAIVTSRNLGQSQLPANQAIVSLRKRANDLNVRHTSYVERTIKDTDLVFFTISGIQKKIKQIKWYRLNG